MSTCTSKQQGGGPPTKKRKHNKNNESNADHSWMEVDPEIRRKRNLRDYLRDAGVAIPIEKFYVEISNYEKDVPKFGMKSHVTRFAFKIPEEKDRPTAEELFKEILQKLIDEAYDNTNVREGWRIEKFLIHLYSEGFTDPLIIPARPKEQNRPEMILNAFMKLEQSYREAKILHNEIVAVITTFAVPEGEGGFNPLKYYQTKPLGLINVENSSNLCLFGALELTRLYQTRNTPGSGFLSYDSWRRLSKNKQRQAEYALTLFEELALEEENCYGIKDLEKIQQYWDIKYPGMFRIIAFDRERGLQPIWKGKEQRQHQVCILHNGNHWHGLKSIGQYFPIHKKYCVDCETTFETDEEHRIGCVARCRKCCRVGYGFPCPRENIKPIYCQLCNRTFYNQSCFDEHKAKICDIYHRCRGRCKREYRVELGHSCGERFCHTCHVHHDPGRPCFIRPIQPPRYLPKYRIVTYDAECTANNRVKDGRHKGKWEHMANFISARVTCSICEGKIKDCEICGSAKEPRHFKWSAADGVQPIECFVDWVTRFKKYPTIAYAHYGGRYDSHLVLSELVNQEIIPEMIIGANKIYQLEARRRSFSNIFFRDSWLLMQGKLADLPKTFGLSCAAKLYFPHKFNREENYGKRLSTLPPFNDYCPETMMPDDYKKFKIWYEANKNTPFLLDEQLDIYCSNDTEILQQAVLKFRQCFLKCTKDNQTPQGYDLLWEAATITGACTRMYKAKFLKEEHLPIVPEGGFERCDNQSAFAIKYFEWIQNRDKVNARHAGNYGEIKIKGNIKLDCLIQEQRKIIEFHGCAYHGCPKCFKPWQKGPNRLTAEENLNNTQQRMQKIRQWAEKHKINVEEVWECDVRQQLKNNKEMQQFFDEQPEKGPINPRRAYFGGRTAPMALYAKAGDGKNIGMADIVSLYPWVNFTAKYPVGVPKIIRPPPGQQKVNWTKPEDLPYKGLLKVRVIPPNNLKIPVLPVHVGEMMLFPLCLACAKKKSDGFKFKNSSSTCEHTVTERAFTNEYTSIELEMALQKGYKIDRFYRAYHYEKWDEDLFKPYVRKFLKLKVEASGWPEEVKTEEDKDEFIRIYAAEPLCVNIEKDKVMYNPGLRHIAKLALNSLWGKFSMRNSLQSSEVVFSASRFFELILDHTIEITQVIPYDQEKLRIVYRKKDTFIEEHRTSNIVVSLWTTARARLKLYEYMEIVETSPGCKILYSDTDSLIYLFPEGKDPLASGQFLGDMSKEYSDCNIKEYVSGGPKQYQLLLENKSDGKIWYKQKIRGFTLDVNNQFDYNEFKSMILEYKKDSKKSFNYEDKFGPTEDAHIINRPTTKYYKPVCTKGIIENKSENLDLIPFGYVD